MEHSGKRFTHCPLAASAAGCLVNLKLVLWEMRGLTGTLTGMVGPGQLWWSSQQPAACKGAQGSSPPTPRRPDPLRDHRCYQGGHPQRVTFVGGVKEIFMFSGDFRSLERGNSGSFRVCPGCAQGHAVDNHDSPACVACAERHPLLSVPP